MNRREFVLSSLGGTMARVPGQGPFGEERRACAEQEGHERLAGMTLEKLRDQFRYDLFDDFLPFMDKYVIDHTYGGFMCNTDRDGTHLSENKEAWFEGRGIWVYSFLYNNFGHEGKYLEVASKSVHFIMKLKPPGKDTLWPSNFSREGKPLAPSAKTIYGDLFIAEGLAEYSKATGDWTYWNLAKAIILGCVRIYDRPDYDPDVVAGYNDLMVRFSTPPSHMDPKALAKILAMYKGPRIIPFPGARAQAASMVLIRNISQMLEMRHDKDLEKIIDHCVDVVVHKHYNPEFRLNNELLNHDYSRPMNELAQFVYAGHCIETLEMLLAEAIRTRNKELFRTAAGRLRRHFDVAWDDVYGGVFRSLINVDDNVWSVDKVLWAQEEALNGLLFMVEQTGDSWAREMFGKMYTYVHKKYSLRQLGFPLWITAADRKVTFERHATRVENYHHPRHLMISLLILDRMIRHGIPAPARSK